MALIYFEALGSSWNTGLGTSNFSGQTGVNGNVAVNIPSTINSFFANALGGTFMNPGNTTSFNFNLGTNTNTLIFGVRYNAQSAIPGQDVFRVLDSAGGTQCGVNFNANSQLILWRGTTATVIGTGTTKVWANTENYIEAKIPIGASVNAIVRMNGATEINVTANTQNTGNANWAVIQNAGLSGTVGYCDLYVCDNTGPAPLNDFLVSSGNMVRVETLYPSANSSVTWTPNASTNVSRVQEARVDSDTTYNSTSATSNVDLFTHGSLVSTPGTIYAVKVASFARKDDVTIRNVRNKLVSSATTANGTTRGVTTIYQLQEDYYTTDPATAAAWANAAAVNGTSIGYELTP